MNLPADRWVMDAWKDEDRDRYRGDTFRYPGFGRTLGSPIALFIENRDWENWQEVMSSESRIS